MHFLLWNVWCITPITTFHSNKIPRGSPEILSSLRYTESIYLHSVQLFISFFFALCSNVTHALKQAVKLKDYRYSSYLKNLVQHWDTDIEKLSPTARQQLLTVRWVSVNQKYVFLPLRFSLLLGNQCLIDSALKSIVSLIRLYSWKVT